jgi:hypothetical protein
LFWTVFSPTKFTENICSILADAGKLCSGITHSRQRQIWSPHKCIHNAFVMFEYVNQFVGSANS